MPVTVRMNPTQIRRNRRARTAFRKWGKTVAANIAFQVENIFCPISLMVQRDPLNPDHQLRGALCVMSIVAAHGYYRQWPA